MRLWLSEKAAKAMAEQDKADAEAREAKSTAEKAKLDERRKAEEEAREAKKAARKAARDETDKCDEDLAGALATCKDQNKLVRDTHYRLRERRKDMAFSGNAVAEAEKALEEAKAALERARTELTRASAEVPGLEGELTTQRAELDARVTRLQGALDVADQAWKSIPPRHRKKRDRRTRHAAVQILNANRRWHERQQGGEGGAPGADLDEPVDVDATEAAMDAGSEGECAHGAEHEHGDAPDAEHGECTHEENAEGPCAGEP